MKTDRDLHQHLDTGTERLSGCFLKVGFQQAKDIRPYRTSRFGYQIIATRGFLYEFQITMSRTVGAHVAQLCLHPVFIGQALFYATTYQRIQVEERKKTSPSCFFPRRKGGIVTLIHVSDL